MRIIRPGKLATSSDSSQQERRRGSSDNRRGESHSMPEAAPPIEVWEDFNPIRKSKRKQEFERGSGNRMLPKALADKIQQAKIVTAGETENSETEDHTPVQLRTDFDELERRLGYQFKDRELLSRALTHRSAVGMKERVDYERLEFLGDAVLDLSVAHMLSDKHPEAREGELSKMRAALVNTQALAHVAKSLDIGPFIRLGRGEMSSGGADRPSILADVTEAIIGAMYHDSGYQPTFEVIEKIFGVALEEVTPFDPKTELQEALHVAGSEAPSYLLEHVEGPEHAPTFVTVVLVDNEIVGRGRGPTKKAAQQSAAAEALKKLNPDAPAVTLKKGQTVVIGGALQTKAA